ncbi:MAG: hypothetical protein WCG06_06075 [Candidatus Omnitrophota bacterium]
MKFPKTASVLLGFLLWSASADAVLQTTNPKKDQSSSSSTLVSNTRSAEPVRTYAASLPPVEPGKMRLRFKPRHPAAATAGTGVSSAFVNGPVVSAPTPQPGPSDPFKLGRSKQTHPQAIQPEPVSPVVDQVSGPPNNLNTQYAKVKSLKPTKITQTITQQY